MTGSSSLVVGEDTYNLPLLQFSTSCADTYRSLLILQHLSDQEVKQLYDKMRPEPITVGADKLALPAGFHPTPCHYILFTDDMVSKLLLHMIL